MKEKRQQLRWWDLLIVTVILFGSGILSSNGIFLSGDPELMEESLAYTTADNWSALISQSFQLLLAAGYLFLRRFDFSQWQFRVTVRGTAAAVGLFLLLAFLVDLANLAVYGLEGLRAAALPGGFLEALSAIDLSLVLFSLLNGVYEEVFFLGVCTAVREKYRGAALVYALAVRISFHTYQGIPAALEIGLILGLVYYALYRRKSRNLYPYTLSHAFADLLGLSLVQFL